MMKYLRLILLLVVCGIPLVGAADLKIGYVNFDRVFRDPQVIAKVNKKLEKEFAARDQDLEKMVKQARELQSSLEKEGLTLSEADRAKKQRDLAAITREIQRTQRAFREDLNQRKNEELANLLDRARKAAQEIADREKFDLILEYSNVIYGHPRLDLTDKVVKALDR